MICNNRDVSKHLGRMQKITVKKDLCWGLNQTQKYSPRDNDPVNPQKSGESDWGNAGAAGARRMGPTLLSWTMRSRWADWDPVLPGEGGVGGGATIALEKPRGRHDKKGGKHGLWKSVPDGCVGSAWFCRMFHPPAEAECTFD